MFVRDWWVESETQDTAEKRYVSQFDFFFPFEKEDFEYDSKGFLVRSVLKVSGEFFEWTESQP